MNGDCSADSFGQAVSAYLEDRDLPGERADCVEILSVR
jgi:hypothetical protein